MDLIKPSFASWFCGVKVSSLDFEYKDPSSSVCRKPFPLEENFKRRGDKICK